MKLLPESRTTGTTSGVALSVVDMIRPMIEESGLNTGNGEDVYTYLSSLLSSGAITDREEYIIRARIGIGEEDGVETISSLASKMKISKVRVRQIEQKGLSKLYFHVTKSYHLPYH